MLRRFCGKTLKNKQASNEEIHEVLGVENMEEFLREQRLRWLGHVERIDNDGRPVTTPHFKLNGSKKR